MNGAPEIEATKSIASLVLPNSRKLNVVELSHDLIETEFILIATL